MAVAVGEAARGPVLPSFWGALGALLAGLAVLGGALGAHGLRSLLTPVAMAAFETSLRYQFFHALALIVIAMLLERPRHVTVRGAAWMMLIGTVLFSGSLYLLT